MSEVSPPNGGVAMPTIVKVLPRMRSGSPTAMRLRLA
jgi:hypothetical protein